jgi:hypothetical protein
MHSPRFALLTALAAAVTAAAAAPSVSAASQRYASPTGSGYDCTALKPCSIEVAIDAKTGDEVIVAPGDYPLSKTLTASPGKSITIHGVAGAPRPRLLFSGPAQKGLDMDSLTAASGSTLRYVEVVQTAAERAIFAGPGATIDQVIARTSREGGVVTATVRNGAVSNSILVASGANGTALATGAGNGEVVSTVARNVTAIATGSGGHPIHVSASTGASGTLHLVNVIAYAGPGRISLKAQTDNTGAQATITASHVSYQSVDAPGGTAKFVSGGGNQAEEPTFVNPAAGDYRQAPGSYTIDAGIDYPGLDVDGDPRRIGTTDIGADEFVPAPPPPPAGPSRPVTTTPAPLQPFAGVALVTRRLAFTRRTITVRLRCPAGTLGRCAGRTKLTARRRKGTRAVTLGRARFSIAPDRRARVKVRVTRAGLRRLRRVPRLRAKAFTAARDGAGQRRTTRTAVTIRHRRAR